MAIPDYQTVMLPLLRLAADGVEHKFREAVEQLAAEFSNSLQLSSALPQTSGASCFQVAPRRPSTTELAGREPTSSRQGC